MVKQGSNERDSSSSTARSSPVILSAAKDLAALRVTLCDCSNCQVQFVQIEPCLTFLNPTAMRNEVNSCLALSDAFCKMLSLHASLRNETFAAASICSCVLESSPSLQIP